MSIVSNQSPISPFQSGEKHNGFTNVLPVEVEMLTVEHLIEMDPKSAVALSRCNHHCKSLVDRVLNQFINKLYSAHKFSGPVQLDQRSICDLGSSSKDCQPSIDSSPISFFLKLRDKFISHGVSIPKRYLPITPSHYQPLQECAQTNLDKALLAIWPQIQKSLPPIDPPLTSAEEIRNWLNDPQNNAAIEAVEELSIEADIKTFPNEINCFSELQSLSFYNFSSCNLDNVSFLTNLRELSLVDSSATPPDKLSSLTNLTTLTLEQGLTSLPESIGSLINLESLDLSANNLTSFPESIGSLINLKSLDLSNNNLRSLPESIGLLTNLSTLNLSKNKLTSLPESIRSLAKLKISMLEE